MTLEYSQKSIGLSQHSDNCILTCIRFESSPIYLFSHDSFITGRLCYQFLRLKDNAIFAIFWLRVSIRELVYSWNESRILNKILDFRHRHRKTKKFNRAPTSVASKKRHFFLRKWQKLKVNLKWQKYFWKSMKSRQQGIIWSNVPMVNFSLMKIVSSFRIFFMNRSKESQQIFNNDLHQFHVSLSMSHW